MILQIVSSDDDATCLRLSDRITFEDFDGHPDPLIERCGSDIHKKKVIVDMSGSEYIDSSGVGWLVASHKKCNNAGGCLALHSFQPEVKKTFAVLRMEYVLNLCEDQQGAWAVVDGEAEQSSK